MLGLLKARRHRGRQRVGFGFTLIELLVVVAVIVVLAGLLMAALQSAKEYGRRTSCTNNLRQLSMLMLMYANDHSGFVPSYVYTGSAGTYVDSPPPPPPPPWVVCHNPPGTPCTAQTLTVGSFAGYSAHLAHGDHPGPCVPADFAGCVETQLGSVLASSGGLLRLTVCPSDWNPESISTTDQNGNTLSVPVSYNQNLEFMRTGIALDRLANPARTILFFDGAPSDCLGAYNVTNYNAKYARFRHLKRVNGSYVDGHAESLVVIPTENILLE